MLFKGGSVPMTQALPADSCDKMRDFLNSLLRTNQSARACGKKLDVRIFMAMYREQHATFITANPRGRNLVSRNEIMRRRDGLRQYLIDHLGCRIAEIAAELRMSPGTVSTYYKELGIPREKLSRHHRKESA